MVKTYLLWCWLKPTDNFLGMRSVCELWISIAAYEYLFVFIVRILYCIYLLSSLFLRTAWVYRYLYLWNSSTSHWNIVIHVMIVYNNGTCVWGITVVVFWGITMFNSELAISLEMFFTYHQFIVNQTNVTVDY